MVPNQGPLVPWTAGFVGPKDDDSIPPEVSDTAGRPILPKALCCPEGNYLVMLYAMITSLQQVCRLWW